MRGLISRWRNTEVRVTQIYRLVLYKILVSTKKIFCLPRNFMGRGYKFLHHKLPKAVKSFVLRCGPDRQTDRQTPALHWASCHTLRWPYTGLLATHLKNSGVILLSGLLLTYSLPTSRHGPIVALCLS